MQYDFISDAADTPLPFSHYWEHTVGSGHATLALRADWQQQLQRCHSELGFKHVRFHGLLSDDMGTLVCQQEKLVYSFFNADQIFDFLLSIGMSPFVEFSFMPLTLSSGGQTVFHYKGNITPPRDYKAWETLISKLVQHWYKRYGIQNLKNWFFEVWNEPNLPAFWTGTQQDYFRLYQHASNAIKKIDPALQVGGPATAANAWIKEFIGFCKHNEVDCDFVSTHHYPTDAFGQPGDDTITQLSKSHRGVLTEQVKETRKNAGTKPVYYTEWSTSSNPFDTLHDQPYAAAYIIKTIMDSRDLIQGYSYWTFSDIFEENYFSSVPFHGGFGLLTINGIAKPAYRGYELLHRLGNNILPVQGQHPTVDAWMVNKSTDLNILLTNSVLPRHPVKTERINIRIDNIAQIEKAFIERIDDTHANARAGWEQMGKPAYLDATQLAKLQSASQLIKEPLLIKLENSSVSMEIELPPQATALVTLKIE